MTDELQNIISGKSKVRFGNLIQTAISYLRTSSNSSKNAQREKSLKNQEKESLITFINQNKLWISNIDFNLYVSEGAEQKVFLNDKKHVWKLNDAIYYESWSDYFINLLLNNYFFPDTAYELKGFYIEADILYAVVVQNFILADTLTNLDLVKEFMLANKFKNTRNNDYFNEELGIILEDLHDENVLTREGVLYFIDTVFYLKK